MKFTCYVNDLKNVLKLAAKCADTKADKWIMATVKITADVNRATFEATNFLLAAQITIPVSVEDCGSVCVNAKLLNNIADKAPEDTITFNTDGNELVTESGASHFRLSTNFTDDFPSITFDADNAARIRAQALRDLIRHTISAASKDNDRPIFRGVHLRAENSTLTAVATNASRIAIDKAEAVGSNFAVTLPVNAAKIILDALPDNAETFVSIHTSDNGATFTADNFKIRTRLIDGDFPDWNKIFDGERTLQVCFKRKEMLGILNRVNIIGKNSQWHAVTFRFKKGSIDITSRNELGAVTELIEVDSPDQNLIISFNINYLLDFLSAADDDDICISLNTGVDPATLSSENSQFVCVLTPVRM